MSSASYFLYCEIFKNSAPFVFMSFVFFMAIANLRLLMPFRNFSIVANPAGLNPSGLKCSDTQSLWTQALWTQSL